MAGCLPWHSKSTEILNGLKLTGPINWIDDSIQNNLTNTVRQPRPLLLRIVGHDMKENKHLHIYEVHAQNRAIGSTPEIARSAMGIRISACTSSGEKWIYIRAFSPSNVLVMKSRSRMTVLVPMYLSWSPMVSLHTSN